MKNLILLLAAAAWAQPVPTAFTFPDSGLYGSGNNTATISAAAHQVAYVFKIPVAGDLTDISFSTVTVTTFAGSDVLTISLETVTAGAPTGTYKGAGTKTYTAGVNAIASTTQYEATLSTQASSVVAGDTVAVRFIMTTFASAASFTLNATSGLASGFPYYARSTDSGSTWTKTGLPKVAVKISGVWYQAAMNTDTPCVEGSGAGLTISMNSDAATYDRYGLRFQYPCAITLAGFWVKMSSSAASTYDAVLWDASHSILSTASYAVADALNTSAIRYFLFATPVTLAANTTYTVGLSATSGTAANTSVVPHACLSTDYIAAMAGGIQFYTDRRTRATTTWAPLTTERPPMGLIINAVMCTTSH